MTQIEIRPYQPIDHNSCVDIFNSNLPLYFAPHEKDYLLNWLNGFNQNRLVYPTNQAEYFYVALKNNTVIACGGFYIPKNNAIANLTWGMVHNNYHKQGVGKELLLYRINYIQEHYPQHKITIDTSQHTYPFFEKLGFKTIKITPNGYGEGLHRYDMEG